jgi:hypothetical protein
LVRDSSNPAAARFCQASAACCSQFAPIDTAMNNIHQPRFMDLQERPDVSQEEKMPHGM